MAFSEANYDVYNAVHAMSPSVYEMFRQQDYNQSLDKRKKSDIYYLKR